MEIRRLEWDDTNRSKLRTHGIVPAEVRSIVATDDWVVALHPDYPDQVRIVGPTDQGRMLTIVLEPTNDPSFWRPVTGWPTTSAEIAYYREERR